LTLIDVSSLFILQYPHGLERSSQLKVLPGDQYSQKCEILERNHNNRRDLQHDRIREIQCNPETTTQELGILSREYQLHTNYDLQRYQTITARHRELYRQWQTVNYDGQDLENVAPGERFNIHEIPARLPRNPVIRAPLMPLSANAKKVRCP
jgi:hypothetical protein